MLKSPAQIAFIAGGLGGLLMGLTLGGLKAHEDEIVFAAARGRQHLLTVLPADAQRVTVPEPNGVALAALVYRADGNADDAMWVLHLHGNADSAFSPWQVRHCEALRSAGFNVLEIDYRGFGPTPGKPSETAMYEDSEAAYQELLRRGIPANSIILLGHSLGSGPAVWLATRHAAAYRYPYLPVRLAVGVQFNSLARIGDVHIPVVIAHSRDDKVIPYAHALTLLAAANEPKRLITFDTASNDGFGGHVDALYDHVDILKATLATLIPALGERSVAQTPQ